MPISKKVLPTRAATLADVGRAAGVSAMAASAVLNSARTSSRIAPETRKRILAAAARLNYRPNIAARALANRRMHTLGVVAVTDRGALNHYFLELLGGILATAGAHEENTTVFAIHDWKKDAGRLHGMCDGRIDGLILLAPTLPRASASLLPAHTPFVALHANSRIRNVLNIESDEEHGARQMTRHLIAQGHRDIMHITGPRGFIGAERRIRGYKQALADAGIPPAESRLVPAGFSTAGGREALIQWLRHHRGEPLPTAIFCANDGVAMGCLEVFAEIGLRVPDDISIAGFDDTLAARLTVPALTTVRQPLQAMGSRAVEALLDRIQQPGSSAPREPIVFPVELIVRNSVGRPPAPPRTVPEI
ncbi:MAG TPA: LacI family DNA-binding transcriptional regulator [Opitutus sp.]|nr:LacI family DNA-binding transcriptional regulator [Opitutus sp.]